MEGRVIAELVIGQDESILKDVNLTPSLPMPWIKARFTLTNKRLVGRSPRFLLGIIPAGNDELTYNLRNVASVATGTKVELWSVILCLLFLAFGLGVIGSSPLAGLVLLLIAVYCALTAVKVSLKVSNNAGQIVGYPLSLKDKSNVAELASLINTAIANLTT